MQEGPNRRRIAALHEALAARGHLHAGLLEARPAAGLNAAAARHPAAVGEEPGRPASHPSSAAAAAPRQHFEGLLTDRAASSSKACTQRLQQERRLQSPDNGLPFQQLDQQLGLWIPGKSQRKSLMPMHLHRREVLPQMIPPPQLKLSGSVQVTRHNLFVESDDAGDLADALPTCGKAIDDLHQRRVLRQTHRQAEQVHLVLLGSALQAGHRVLG
mmetsp:Transcript_18368/g.51008  ORF Transcript_18368/g.51008 Transcript_18368/m.51008 type:complete len:215 (+) Transcript_18368:786-1430(+)